MFMNFGERLKNLREDRDEKQRDIAKLLYLSTNMVSAYELGKHFPKNEKSLIALAKHFNVSIDYLLGYSDIPNFDNENIVSISGLNSAEKALVFQMIDLFRNNHRQKHTTLD